MADQPPFARHWNHNSHYYPRIAELLDGHRVVLDVGCGEGTLARYLATGDTVPVGERRDGLKQPQPAPESFDDKDLRHEVVGIDADAKVLAPDAPGVHFMLADAQQLPFPDASFDAVVSVGVLHHLNEDLGLVEMRRVLRPGGRLVVIDTARSPVPFGPLEIRDMAANLVLGLGKTRWRPDTLTAEPDLNWTQSRELIEGNLPGAHWWRVPLWRWVAVWDAPAARRA